MSHHHGHDHLDPVAGRRGHGVGRFGPSAAERRGGHWLGRRRFLADLGRGTLAVAIFGTGAAACGGSADDPAAASPSPSSPGSPTVPEPTATGEPASDAPDPTASPVDGDGADGDAAAEGLRWSQVALGSVSAYVLARGNAAALVDSGNPGSVEAIGATLADLGLHYGDVAHVILTHHHPDHVGSLAGVLGEAPTAIAYAGEADIANISAPNPLQALADGDTVFGLEVVHTPGHTPGSISVFDPGIGLLVAGDALNGNADGTAVTGPNERFTADMDTALASVRRLAELDGVEAAAFGHGNPVRSGAGALLGELAASI